MHTIVTLEELKVAASRAPEDFNQLFRSLHHFSKQPPFSTPPSNFSEFVSYCERLSRGIRPGGENERTIQRAYLYIERMKTTSKSQSLEDAWHTYPLVRSHG